MSKLSNINPNLPILLGVFAITAVLCIIWYIFFSNYVKKQEEKEKQRRLNKINALKNAVDRNKLKTLKNSELSLDNMVNYLENKGIEATSYYHKQGDK